MSVIDFYIACSRLLWDFFIEQLGDLSSIFKTKKDMKSQRKGKDNPGNVFLLKEETIQKIVSQTVAWPNRTNVHYLIMKYSSAPCSEK